METIEQQAKLTEKHEMIIKQQTTPAKDLVESIRLWLCRQLQALSVIANKPSPAVIELGTKAGSTNLENAEKD